MDYNNESSLLLLPLLLLCESLLVECLSRIEGLVYDVFFFYKTMKIFPFSWMLFLWFLLCNTIALFQFRPHSGLSLTLTSGIPDDVAACYLVADGNTNPNQYSNTKLWITKQNNRVGHFRDFSRSRFGKIIHITVSLLFGSNGDCSLASFHQRFDSWLR